AEGFFAGMLIACAVLVVLVDIGLAWEGPGWLVLYVIVLTPVAIAMGLHWLIATNRGGRALAAQSDLPSASPSAGPSSIGLFATFLISTAASVLITAVISVLVVVVLLLAAVAALLAFCFSVGPHV